MNTHSLPRTTTTSSEPGIALTRRRMVQGLAWTVPAITIAGAAPAFAASTGYALVPNPTGTGEPVAVQRCQPVDLGQVTFTATLGDSPVVDNEVIQIVLPTGLSFVDDLDGDRNPLTTTVRPVGGIVQVPAFVATGAAGTYSITALFRGQVATQSVLVTPAPGAVVEIRRSTAAANGTATFTYASLLGISTAVAGAIQGDQSVASSISTGANGAVLTSARTVHYWGNHTGSPASKPGTLRYANKNLTGLTTLDTWTSISSGNTTAGGVTAGATDTIYSWYHSNGAAPVVVRVTGPTGTLLAVAAEDGHSYVLTSDGVWQWANVANTSGTSPTTVAAPIKGTAGASTLSTWSTRGPSGSTLRYGGAALVGNQIATWSGTNTATVAALPAGMTGVTKLLVSDSAYVALTSSGGLWTSGTAFGGSTWVQRVTAGVIDFSMWGFTTDRAYGGGLWFDAAGRTTQFFGNGSWSTPTPVREKNTGTAGTDLSGITKTFSSDGTYLALKTDGTVYAWGGNLDNSGRGPATTVSTGSGRVVDLNVWGHHIGDIYYGGGYVIKADVVSC